MSRIEIRVPPLGEAAPQAVVARWYRQPGEYVARDQVLAELSTDKVDIEVAATADGWLAAIHAPEGTTVAVDELIALLETTPGLVSAPVAPPRPPEASCLRCGVRMEPANTSPAGLPFASRVRLFVCRTCGRVEMIAEDPGAF
jgi:2-oxoglutarate dehydrogenase E2 component (dihydrolipoamide succinyltransferase)